MIAHIAAGIALLAILRVSDAGISNREWTDVARLCTSERALENQTWNDEDTPVLDRPSRSVLSQDVGKQTPAHNSNRVRRHEFRIGWDTDTFNYTGAASTEIIALSSRWTERWSTRFAGSFYQRFGQYAEKFNAGATYRFTRRDWITGDVGVSNRQDIVSQEDLNLEYGHTFPLKRGLIRGIESYLQQKNLWYSTSRVTTIGTTQVLYLPRDWMWTVSVTGVRTAFGGKIGEWTLSGFTRLSVPATSRLAVHALFAVGAENFAKIDQIGRFSARTFGGGVRVQVSASQDISGYVAYQDRTQGRNQTTVGVSYGRRF